MESEPLERLVRPPVVPLVAPLPKAPPRIPSESEPLECLVWPPVPMKALPRTPPLVPLFVPHVVPLVVPPVAAWTQPLELPERLPELWNRGKLLELPMVVKKERPAEDAQPRGGQDGPPKADTPPVPMEVKEK